MKRAIAFVIAFAFVTLAYWLGGFDFDKRGAVLAVWFLLSTGAGLLIAGYPGFDE